MRHVTAPDFTPGKAAVLHLAAPSAGNETGMNVDWWELPRAVAAATDGSLTFAGGELGVLLFAERVRSARLPGD